MKQIAIIGPTASGKTGLSIEMAHKTNSIILSLDSLSVYKDIDIASAKPTKEERGGIVHFGIDEVYPNETFDVMQFLDCYYKACSFAKQNNQNLIIVGGTGFYLKILLEGMSVGVDSKEPMDISIQEAYKLLLNLDPIYMQKIKQNDKYRIEKAYMMYKHTKLIPTEFFIQNPKIAIAPDLKIFEIIWETEALRERIKIRTKQMINQGVIDEVIQLERKYTRFPNCMSTIGIVESLEYLDGRINKDQLEEKISVHTSQLAKRQRTFNRSQFNDKQTKNILTNLNSDILKYFSI